MAPPSVATGRLRGQAWEQLVLPSNAARARASLIFSPANLAPVAWPRNVVLVHDAAVLREPGSYSRAYAAWHRSVGVAAARRATRVLTVSAFARRELIELLGLESDRVVVISGGVGERFTTNADREQATAALGLGRPYVLTVSTADRRKNLAVLDETARQLRDMAVDLVWAGDERSYFATERGLVGARRVGYVPDEHLPGLYAGALAFVLPSRYEGLGLPCLEAMACGTPVVAANTGALPETCGDAALLVEVDDRAAFASAVVAAISDSLLRERLIADGRERASRFTWDRAAAETNALLLTLT